MKTNNLGIGMLAAALMAMPSSGPMLRPSPPREPRPVVRYLSPRSQRKKRAAAMALHERNLLNAKHRRSRREPRSPEQLLIAKMTNWQRTHYSAEHAAFGGGAANLERARKWVATVRP